MPKYEFRFIKGHVEVSLHGSFVLSADTKDEALRELEEHDA